MKYSQFEFSQLKAQVPTRVEGGEPSSKYQTLEVVMFLRSTAVVYSYASCITYFFNYDCHNKSE